MDKKKNINPSLSKSRLKDLCKEDKARVGDLIDKLALEKLNNSELQERLARIEKELEDARAENQQVIQEKESLARKLEKCMNLIKEMPKKAQVCSVDVFTQTIFIEDFQPTQPADYFVSSYDEKLYSLVEVIENDPINSIDLKVLDLIHDLEFSS